MQMWYQRHSPLARCLGKATCLQGARPGQATRVWKGPFRTPFAIGNDIERHPLSTIWFLFYRHNPWRDSDSCRISRAILPGLRPVPCRARPLKRTRARRSRLTLLASTSDPGIAVMGTSISCSCCALVALERMVAALIRTLRMQVYSVLAMSRNPQDLELVRAAKARPLAKCSDESSVDSDVAGELRQLVTHQPPAPAASGWAGT